MLASATKYTDVRAAANAARTSSPVKPFHVRVARGGRKAESVREFMEREFREGGLFREYLRREKYLTEQRHRQVARQVQHHRPNPKSDFKLIAQVSARDYMRWKAQDKHFWMDDNNLRSLRRDNDALRHCIHV